MYSAFHLDFFFYEVKDFLSCLDNTRQFVICQVVFSLAVQVAALNESYKVIHRIEGINV